MAPAGPPVACLHGQPLTTAAISVWRLGPGERFEYTSGVPLPTASGFMTGRYQMVSESGERFEIDVPTFSLDSPDNRRVLN